ncbi:MAG: tetratricopeptide repeat protein [Coriobacteriaceae bacterium]|uniref:tetratricopeptide repeat protein n=1 Tax=Tractidigestivibacter sp. TaxID=2847320 RepID=UPI002A83BC97|nr:tetratricopeptide repeat protein [Tractidigestivibacter sp.]MCI7438716.1 tetratricopeptide repeat protein [Coriobacteriaceae bacterium]MDY4533680.1 tetratricopeptide repeat protein [Tractidigestivibacter sp.]
MDVLARVDAAWQAHRTDPIALERALLSLRDEVALSCGTASSEYVTLCNELGSFYRSRGNYQCGEASFSAALAGIEALAGRSDAYATCLDNLAELYRLDGRLDECAAALAEASALFSDAHSLEYAACLNYQGHLCMARRDPTGARMRYQEALAIVRENGSPAFELSTAFANVASALMEEGNLADAARHLDAACDLYRNGSLRHGPHYVSLLNSLATLYDRMGDVAAARAPYGEVLDSLESGVPVNPDDARAALANAASFFSRTADSQGTARVEALRKALTQ